MKECWAVVYQGNVATWYRTALDTWSLDPNEARIFTSRLIAIMTKMTLRGCTVVQAWVE